MRSRIDHPRTALALIPATAAVLLVLLGVTAAARALPGPAARARAGIASAVTTAKIGVASSKYLDGDEGRLSAIGATWSYDWSATAPAPDRHLAWVPMIWGSGSITPAVLASLRRDKQDGTARDLLGFNEPDSGSQANLTPAQAAALWPRLERTGLRLGSPAPAVPSDGWLAQFMQLVKQRHLRVNFMALHDYQDFTDPNAVEQLRAQLIAIHRAYGRPIWITEIGSIDIRDWGEYEQNNPTVARAQSYMKRLFAMLNSLAFVQRYAWFTDNCWNDGACHTSSLFNAQNRLTPLGRTFAHLAEPAAAAAAAAARARRSG